MNIARDLRVRSLLSSNLFLRPVSASDASSPEGDGRLLVVDDNRDVLTALRLLLKEHVDTVHTAQDPSVIPTLLRDHSYDTICST